MRMGRLDARLGPVAWAGAEASWWRSFVVCTRVAQEGPLTDAAEMDPEWCIADIALMPSRLSRGKLVLHTD
jgi:hypothetical protein